MLPSADKRSLSLIPPPRWKKGVVPRMDSLAFTARVLHFVFAGLKAAGVPPIAAMKPGELSANAHGLGYAILASLWKWRHSGLAWDHIYASWEGRLPDPGEVDPALYGQFHPEDEISLLIDNAAAFREREVVLKSARQTVEIATYYIQADETGWNFARQLADLAGRGVRVRVIADDGATQRKIFENPDVANLGDFLRRSGVDYRLFLDPTRPYDSGHRKALVVDDSTLITGGRNYADHYSGSEWRDIDLVLRGPSVKELRPLFDATFTCSSVLQPSPASSLFQGTTPENICGNACFLFLLQCIRAARRTIDIENAYYINHPVLQTHLAAACARGIRVRLFTNSAESNDVDFTNYRIYAGLPALLAAGVQVFLRNGRGKTLHPKYFVVDGEWVGFGSTNLNFYSPRFGHEMGIHVRSSRLGVLLTEFFESGLTHADQIKDSAPIEAAMKTLGVSRLFDRLFSDLQ